MNLILAITISIALSIFLINRIGKRGYRAWIGLLVMVIIIAVVYLNRNLEYGELASIYYHPVSIGTILFALIILVSSSPGIIKDMIKWK